MEPRVDPPHSNLFNCPFGTCVLITPTSSHQQQRTTAAPLSKGQPGHKTLIACNVNRRVASRELLTTLEAMQMETVVDTVCVCVGREGRYEEGLPQQVVMSGTCHLVNSDLRCQADNKQQPHINTAGDSFQGLTL